MRQKNIPKRLNFWLFCYLNVLACSTYYQIKIDERTMEHALSKQFFLLMNAMVWSKKFNEIF